MTNIPHSAVGTGSYRQRPKPKCCFVHSSGEASCMGFEVVWYTQDTCAHFVKEYPHVSLFIKIAMLLTEG